MPKRVNVLPSGRVDIPDYEAQTSEYTRDLSKLRSELLWLQNRAAIAEGFRVEIANQTTSPGLFTVVNGVALSRDGQVMNSEDDLAASRSVTLTADATYYIEVEFIENQSDVESRAFWDPTYDNGTDTSGDVLPDGREFNKNVATRQSPDWQVVQPISTTAFDYVGDPDSVRIPVAVLTVSGGQITGGATTPARTVLVEDILGGVTELRGLNTRHFPSTFTLRIDPGGAGAELVSVTANDRENGILSLGGPTTNPHTAGTRLADESGTPIQLLDERTDPAIPSSGTEDARPRFFQPDEDRGQVLTEDPYNDPGRSDLSISSLKDMIDAFALEHREIKWGTSATERWYEETVKGLDLTARQVPDWITIGDDSISVFGQLNRGDFASDDLLLDAAITAAAALGSGATIYVKPGVTLDNFASDVTIPDTTTVRFLGNSRQNPLGQTFSMDTFQFVCANGGSGTLVFENCTFHTDNASTNGRFIDLGDDFILTVENCFFLVLTTGTAAVESVIGAGPGQTSSGAITLRQNTLLYSSDADTATVDVFLDMASVPISNTLIKENNCTFLTGTQGNAVDLTFIRALELRENIRIVDNFFLTQLQHDANSTAYMIDLASSTDGVNGEQENQPGREIARNVFAGPDPNDTGGFADFGGIRCTDMQWTDIKDNEFRYTDATSIIRLDNATAFIDQQGFLIKDNRFVQTASSAIITMNASNNNSIERCRIEGNEKPNGVVSGLGQSPERFLDLDIAGTGDLDDLWIFGNRVGGTTLEITVADDINRLYIENNRFGEGSATNLVPTLDISGADMEDISIRSNRWQDHDATDVINARCLRIVGTLLQACRIEDNLFQGYEVQAVTDAVIRLSVDTINCTQVCANTVWDCFNNSSPALGIFLKVEDSGGGSIDGSSLTIDNNVVDGLTDEGSNVRFTDMEFDDYGQLRLCNNSVRALRDNSATINLISVATTLESFQMSDNTFWAGGAAALSMVMLSISGGGITEAMHIVNNDFGATGSGGTGLGDVSLNGHGIRFLMFRNNIGHTVGSGGMDAQWTVSGATAITLSDPAVPSISAYWPDNLNLQRTS